MKELSRKQALPVRPQEFRISIRKKEGWHICVGISISTSSTSISMSMNIGIRSRPIRQCLRSYSNIYRAVFDLLHAIHSWALLQTMFRHKNEVPELPKSLDLGIYLKP